MCCQTHLVHAVPDVKRMIRLYESMTRIRTQADRMAGITRKPMRITRYETGDYMEGRKIADQIGEIRAQDGVF